MKTVKDLTREQLEEIVSDVQECLWASFDGDGNKVWEPDLEWDSENIEIVANNLERFGLKPDHAA